MTTRNQSLNGPTGLIAAVVARAWEDLDAQSDRHRESAQRYFASGAFRHHLEVLDHDPDGGDVRRALAARGIQVDALVAVNYRRSAGAAD